MTLRRSDDFDIDALFAALDTERQARGLSWQGLAQEINSRYGVLPIRQISASTISGIRGKRVIEGDGVLQMLRWLNRSPESFIPDYRESKTDNVALPTIPPNRILRFDAQAIYAALDAQRIEQKLTWQQIADEIGGISVGGLTRLAKGGRVAFPEVMRIFRWLGCTAASFTRASPL